MTVDAGRLHAQEATAAERLGAIGLMCLAVACFAGLDAVAKFLVGLGYPSEQVVFARYATNLVYVLIFVNPWTVPDLLRTARPMLQIVRGLLLFGSTAMNFTAVKYLQLAETVSIMFATPLITALLAATILRERIGLRHWIAITVGFLGVLVITRPGLGGMDWAALYSLGGTICYAVYTLMTRSLAAHDKPTTTIVLSSAVGAVVALPVMAVPGSIVWPANGFDTGLLALTGALGLVGHWFLTLAHRHASAAKLTPFIYSQMIWMVLLGWLVFGDVPGPFTVIGAAIVIASGLYLLTLERRPTP